MQKYLIIVAILGAIAGMNLGMISQHVKADGTGSCPCGNGQGFWTCKNCDDYQQQPQANRISEYSCHWWSDGFSHCGPGGYSYNQQPTVTQTAFFRDNCFWSYPVQCSSGLNLHLRTL